MTPADAFHLPATTIALTLAITLLTPALLLLASTLRGGR